MEPKPQRINTDIVFVVDSSSDVNQDEYRQQKDFVKNVASILGVERSKARAGLITYGSRSLISFGLGAYADKNDLTRKIDITPYIGGQKSIGKALTDSIKVFQNSYKLSQKILLLLSVGSQTPKLDDSVLSRVSNTIKAMNIKSYVISLKTKTRPQQFLPVVNDPRNIMVIEDLQRLRARQTFIAADISRNTGMLSHYIWCCSFKIIKLYLVLFF